MDRKIAVILLLTVFTVLFTSCAYTKRSDDQIALVRGVEGLQFEDPEGSQQAELAMASRSGGKASTDGFEYCCGNDKYKIMCNKSMNRTVRCYINRNGKWEWTYGHYCKSNIPDCYSSAPTMACCK
jgi:hypothetical protein